MVIVFDPEGTPLHSLLEAVELSPLEELAQNRFPEALDFAQRHRVVGTGTDMLNAVLFHLPFEAGLASPVRVLPAVVGEHLFGNTILGNAAAICLQHMGGGLATIQAQAGNIPAVVVQKSDQVSVATRQAEGHDVALPQLVRTGAFEKSGLGWILHRLVLGLVYQPLLRERFVYS